jgi:lactam utilization protein B
LDLVFQLRITGVWTTIGIAGDIAAADVVKGSANAVFTNEKSVAEQVSLLMQEKKIKAMDGTIIDVAADTICIHADTPNALAFAKVIFSIVKNK